MPPLVPHAAVAASLLWSHSVLWKGGHLAYLQAVAVLAGHWLSCQQGSDPEGGGHGVHRAVLLIRLVATDRVPGGRCQMCIQPAYRLPFLCHPTRSPATGTQAWADRLTTISPLAFRLGLTAFQQSECAWRQPCMAPLLHRPVHRTAQPPKPGRPSCQRRWIGARRQLVSCSTAD